MKNKVIKIIIKIYFLIEKAEHNRCLNHTLHPLLCQINLRVKDSNSVLDICSVYPLSTGNWQAVPNTYPGTALQDEGPAPSMSRCPSSDFKASVHGRFKLLVETFFYKHLIMRSLGAGWQSSLISHLC